MVIRLLGQAGAEVTLHDGTRILIDPYLSDSLRKQKGDRFTRLVPMPENLDVMLPQIIAITHDHGDHLDMETLEHWLDGEAKLQVLGPLPVFQEIVRRWPGKHIGMVMRPGVEVSLGNARFCAVPASHESPDAVGYLLKEQGKTVYFSGDTLYTRQIPEFLQEETIDLALVCINGFGNNMNCMDAARLVRKLRPGMVIPVHWDMFGAYGADPEEFTRLVEQEIPVKILRAYEQITI